MSVLCGSRPGRVIGLALAIPVALALPSCCDISSITTQSLPDATVGEPYSLELQHNCSGESSAYDPFWIVEADEWPPGLNFSGARFSGTPTTPGTYVFLVRLGTTGSGSAPSDFNVDTATFSLTVRPSS